MTFSGTNEDTTFNKDVDAGSVNWDFTSATVLSLSPISTVSVATTQTLTDTQAKEGRTYMTYADTQTNYTLPADPENGWVLCFDSFRHARTLTINPNSTESIWLKNAATLVTQGSNIHTTQAGETVCLRALDSQTWYAWGDSPNWDAE
jgi:hypothetical protein